MDERFLYKKSQTLREYVSSFHLIIMFLGLAITSIGAYLINSNISKTVSILLLAIGGLITITSFIGYFGAQLENTGFLNTYSSITAIALILELVGISLAYTHKLQLYNYGSKVWSFFYNQDARFLSEVEQLMQCCGYNATNDRAAPKTCSISLGVQVGCKESIVSHFQQWHEWITVIIIILLFIEFMSLVISVITSVIMDREAREEETYMTLLSSRHNNNYHPWSLSNNNGSEASYNFGRHYRSSQKSIPRYGSTPSTK